MAVAVSKHAKKLMELLDGYYGTENAVSLEYADAFQLLIATILSAQCTDARVNLVTKELFLKYTCPEDFAKADVKELEKDIHSTGFYHHKAKNIIACSRDIVEKFGGQVPRSMEELTSLAGVGRKTANVIRGNVYGDASIVVDTHVKRISKRLGMTKEDDPAKVERDLMKRLPEDHWILWNMQLIRFGREICKAQSPKCGECFLREECPEGKARLKQAEKAKPKLRTERKRVTKPSKKQTAEKI